ncbi:MAG: Rpp14/Pop5 family protein [Candidatus Bathyarchaeota archaeon]|jgi:RNase P/RNase MRP subunit POP5|nr:Rpp14/Pop5 family protein [Candidatus Bathyarchaeota archaeon]
MPVRLIRRRYLLFKVTSEATPDEKTIWEHLRNSVYMLYGAKGLSLIDPNLIEYDEKTKAGIVRCTHDTDRFLRASLASIVAISGSPAALRVQRSSGTIKSLRRKSGLENPKKEVQ